MPAFCGRITPHFNDTQHWEARAEEARVQAEQMTSESAKQTMFRIASGYDMMAVRAAIRIGEK